MTPPDARQIAFEILSRVDEGAYADLALSTALEGLDDRRERGLATELVYGVLRRRGRLDFALARFCKQPLSRLEPAVHRLLRLGAYQLLELDRVPARAAVHATVELARRRGLHRASGFLNGVLRALDRGREAIPWPDPGADPRAALVHGHSLPDWLAGRWLEEYGRTEALALASAMAEPAPLTLRVNTLRTDREAFLGELAAAGHLAVPTDFAPEGVVVRRQGGAPLPGEGQGLFQVQDEASMLVAHLVAPGPGERLLDACAAPGGKTTHLAALAANEARILALDLHPGRVELVRAGAERLGCAGVEARAWDLSRIPDFVAPASFDAALVDAPCSGLGVLRRNPEIRWRRRPDDPARLAKLQGTILANVAGLVRPGGRLVYSVCTQTPEETGAVIEAFLAARPDFEREDLATVLPGPWAPLLDDAGALRTLPHRHGGMDAFWAVRLRRSAEG